MSLRAIRVFGILAALVVGLTVGTAAMATITAPRCHAAQDSVTAAPSPGSLAAVRWDCTSKPRNFRPERVLLRFDLQPGQPMPTALTTRISDFAAIHVLTVGANGSIAAFHHSPADARPLGEGFRMALPVPAPPGGDARQVIVAIDQAWVAPLISDAVLVERTSDIVLPVGMTALLTALCVLMIVSAVVDIVLYVIRPKRFLFWHVVSIAGMLLLSLNISGLLALLFAPSVVVSSALLPISSAMALGGGAMFAAHLFEKDTLPLLTRRLLAIAATLTLVSALVYAFKLPAMRSFGIDLYYVGMLPLIALFMLAVGQALRRGSVAARYQLVGSLPIWVLLATRIFTNLGVGDEPRDAIVASIAAQTFEIVVTTIAALLRFVALLRQERRQDRARADALARETESDPLTGLFNRRALDARFEDLRAQGFGALALLDLDHFKRVNDSHGHLMGDKVLQLCAKCMSEAGDDLRAFRIGGEEFVLLLRGTSAAERVEAMRAAIRDQASELVTGLETPITASVGLVEVVDRGGPVPSFEDLYKQADALLYQAKAGGRDRVESLRLTCFPAGEGRPASLVAVND
jgi:diguanylate cyclase (GGDEF)-like protein